MCKITKEEKDSIKRKKYFILLYLKTCETFECVGSAPLRPECFFMLFICDILTMVASLFKTASAVSQK